MLRFFFLRGQNRSDKGEYSELFHMEIVQIRYKFSIAIFEKNDLEQTLIFCILVPNVKKKNLAIVRRKRIKFSQVQHILRVHYYQEFVQSYIRNEMQQLK